VISSLGMLTVKVATRATLGLTVWIPAISMPLLWASLLYFTEKKTFTNAIIEPMILALLATLMAAVHALSVKHGTHWSFFTEGLFCLLGMGITLVVWFLMPEIPD
jgi:hypothetical protein